MDGALSGSTGAFRYRAAGTDHYQDAIWTAVDGAKSELKRSLRVRTLAMLVPEPRNPHDPNAVAVFIDGRHVGYVPRDPAAALSRRIRALGAAGRLTGACEASIVGPAAVPTAGRPTLAVYLDL